MEVDYVWVRIAEKCTALIFRLVLHQKFRQSMGAGVHLVSGQSAASLVEAATAQDEGNATTQSHRMKGWIVQDAK